MIKRSFCCNNKFVPLTINKTDSVSGTGLAGAVFELIACNGFACGGTTDSNGLLIFFILTCNTYMLREVSPPQGYAPVDHVFNICVDACSCIFADGILTDRIDIADTVAAASFTAVKVNIENGMPLAGSLYTLYSGTTPVASASSTDTGSVTFSSLSPGTYELVETTPPPGFQSNPSRLPVEVAPNGSVTIVGEPANGFRLTNVPLTRLIFWKLSGSTGMPLAGATFELTQNSTVIATAVSGSDGLVDLGVLADGTYQLTETVTPPGFTPNSTVYQVVTGMDGSITVDGVPLAGFVVTDTPIAISEPPAINNIVEGDTVITGTGIPVSMVTVTFPNGQTVTAMVDSSGTWLVNVPVGVDLVAGEIVSAIQTEPGKLPSSEVSATVLASLEIEPYLAKTIENLTGEAVQPGDVLRFQIMVGNIGSPGTVWPNATLTDYIIEDLTFIAGSVAVNGQIISIGTGSGQYTYDDVTRTLTVNVGNIASGAITEVTFLVTVNLDAAGSEIINSVEARSASGLGAGPVRTASSPRLTVAG